MVATAPQFQKQTVDRLCRKYGVRRLWLFGSAARGEMSAESDLDVLVEFDEGRTPGFIKFGELSDALSAAFQSQHPVDLVTDRALHHMIRPHVLRERVLLYER